MSAAPDHSSLRSRRHVTTGYTNALHRVYLYGTGLDREQLAQPFVGVAVASTDNSPWSATVRAAADRVLRDAWAARLTPRQFVVPVQHGRADAVRDRELVADSAELAVRGHWYDGLIGVAADAPAIYGLAMALLRLRVPGRIVVPDGLALNATEAVRALVGLGVVTDALDGVLTGVADDIDTGGSVADVAEERLRMGPASVAVPGLATDGLVHLAAVLHEIEAPQLTAMLTADAFDAGGRTRLGVLTSRGLSWPVVHDLGSHDQRVTRSQVTGSLDGQLAAWRDGRGGESGRVLFVRSEDGAHVDRAGDTLSLTSAPGALAPFGDLAPLVNVGRVGAVQHPGRVDSELNYERL